MPSEDRLRTLTRPKTLLLFGGAFGFVLLVACVLTRYRLVPDVRASVPEAAVVSVVILDAEAVSSMGPLLPPAMRYRLETDDDRTAVFFAIPDDETGGLEWIDLATLSSVSPHVRKWRLVRRSDDFYGEIRPDRRKPVSLTGQVDGRKVIIRVGRIARGWSPEAGADLVEPRRLKALPFGTTAYIYSPSARDAAIMLTGLEAEYRGTRLGASLFSTLPGTLEVAVSASGSDEKLLPFVAYSRLHGRLDRQSFRDAAKNLIGSLDPGRVPFVLEDETVSQELKVSPDFVGTAITTLRSGEIERFTGPSKTALSAYFDQENGEVWLTSGTTTVPIQLAILSTVGTTWTESPECRPSGRSPGFILTKEVVDETFAGVLPSIGFVSGFNKLTFVLNDGEFGLFTLCGYF